MSRPAYLLPADLADARIVELEDDLVHLRSEIERLRCKLLPLHFITAPEVLRYLESFKEKLTMELEREQINATILAIQRLQNSPKAVAWFQPQGETP